MTTPTKLFDIECEDDTVIIMPKGDLGEFDYQQLVDDASEALDQLDRSTNYKNVVVDLQRTDYFGSTALGLFLKLWKRVRSRNGCMAFSNVSEHSQEIFRLTRLESLWPICATRAEALSKVRA